MPDQPQPLKTPDIPKSQLIAVAQAIIAVAIAFGVPISNEQSVALIALAGLIGTVLIGSDAAIRRARAQNADKINPPLRVATETSEGTTTTVVAPQSSTEAGDGRPTTDETIELLRQILEALRSAQPTNGRTSTTERRSPVPIDG